MSVPRLWKKLSQRSLRKRSLSTDSYATSDSQKTPPGPTSEPVPPLPPLPPPKSPIRNGSHMTRTPPSALRRPAQSSSPPLMQNNSEEEANGSHIYGVNLKSFPGVSYRSRHGSEEDLLKELAAPWSAANPTSNASQPDKTLQTIEDTVLRAQSNQEIATMVITGTTAVFNATGGTQAIDHGLDSFLEGSAVLMDVLDDVAKLHPFIGVAVLAFKAVWALEMKRRENDKKIIALYMGMKDMMGVLLLLKDVKDVEAKAPDGSTIKGRLGELVHITAEDIKKCMNACDTYSKKKLVVKVLKGPIWDVRLLSFVDLFRQRRKDFEFALSIHTSRGVDAANKTLGGVDAKMDWMIEMFKTYVLPEAKVMAMLVAQKGGEKACQENDKILKELSELEKKIGSPATNGTAAGHKGTTKPSDLKAVKDDLKALKDDLNLDPDDAIKKNMATFSRKFEFQKSQLIKELSGVIQRESDRVISALSTGSHDKIIDPDVHEKWKNMGWRGSVKARNFVLDLRDHFQEKWGLNTHNAFPGTPVITESRNPDEWAIAYFNVVRLQPIREAFDDDASGFVTVSEVNTFTTSRPLDWRFASLPHWIAFWAIGWHQSMTDYATKIRELIAKMFATLPNISLENRASVNEYLHSVYKGITSLEASLSPCDIDDVLQDKFKGNIEAEEARLGDGLEAVGYDIDAIDTLRLVTGRGRIEKFVLPLLYLLLKRHLEIFRICQDRVVHQDELWDAANTVEWVLHAVGERVEALQSIFTQQKLDLKQQFKTFSHGLFQYMNEPNGLWDPKIVLETEVFEYPYDENSEAEDVDHIRKIGRGVNND